MNPAIKKKWLKALRSGKYKQTRGALRRKSTGGMCCIGVLGHVQGVNANVMDGLCSSTLPNQKYWAGLVFSDFRQLANLNDSYRWSFKKIADWVEENL